MRRRSTSPRSGTVRIIAGQWRGSRLDVPDVDGLRPSSDRVRETLFNWLQGYVAGARCLDVFAGSGALGLEAASRGASEVVMIETDRRAVANLRSTVERLKATQVELVACDALDWLGRCPDRSFDMVFVDPPFSADLQQRALDAVLPWLSDMALVYVECGPDSAQPALPGFELWRTGNTRDSHFCVLRRNKGLPAAGAPATLESSSGAATTS